LSFSTAPTLRHKDLAAQIAEEHSLNPIAALLAVIRGLRDNEEIEDFFDPNPFFTLDPFALPDMDKASSA